MARTSLLAVLVLALSLSAASAASLTVVEARGINLAPGSTIDAGKPLVLKPGQHVTLISDAGATLSIDGPYNAPPSAGSTGRSLGTTLAALRTEESARTNQAGVTRHVDPLNKLPNPWLFDVSHSGNVCLQQGAVPVFWRPDSRSSTAFTVVPVDRSWKSQAAWPAGLDRITVTTDVPMHGGAAYVVTYTGGEYALAVFNVPVNLANDEMRAAWMLHKGCDAQAEALLNARK
ncbi:MAG TPA: hypothetical protein VG387_05490 [Rhizomicrobium sp.]|jgi:hypothetical protein|nr:hypothetical protein [Rhizomicrobium sp.]